MNKIFFPVSARNWTVMQEVQLIYDGKTAIFNASRGIYSPAEYSFHCQNVNSFNSPLLVPRDLNNPWKVVFTDFQVFWHFTAALFSMSYMTHQLLRCVNYSYSAYCNQGACRKKRIGIIGDNPIQYYHNL